MSKRIAVFAALLLLPAAAQAQQLYKCIDARGRVTYQEVPCFIDKAQKKVDTSHAGQADSERIAEEAIARRIQDAREESEQLDRQYRRERREREDRLRKEREMRPKIDEDWTPPWGFPAKPGLARKPEPEPEPKPKPETPPK